MCVCVRFCLGQALAGVCSEWAHRTLAASHQRLEAVIFLKIFSLVNVFGIWMRNLCRGAVLAAALFWQRNEVSMKNANEPYAGISKFQKIRLHLSTSLLISFFCLVSPSNYFSALSFVSSWLSKAQMSVNVSLIFIRLAGGKRADLPHNAIMF